MGRNVSVQLETRNCRTNRNSDSARPVSLNVSIIFVSLCLPMSVGKPLATHRGRLAVSVLEAPVLWEGVSDQPSESPWLTQSTQWSGLLQGSINIAARVPAFRIRLGVSCRNRLVAGRWALERTLQKYTSDITKFCLLSLQRSKS